VSMIVWYVRIGLRETSVYVWGRWAGADERLRLS
jgi:hypothetical protein